MENSFSKPYQELFNTARKNFDFEAMQLIFKELCLEVGIPDPPTQEDAQAREQAGIDAGKALAERRNNSAKQNIERNGMLGKKV